MMLPQLRVLVGVLALLPPAAASAQPVRAWRVAPETVQLSPVFSDDFESGDTLAWSSATHEIWSPEPGTTWQWQLSGAVDTSFVVEMYDIDLFDAPDSVIAELHGRGIKVVCYFSAGSYEDWRPDKDEFLAHPDVLGNELDGWEGERWLDIRRLDVLGSIMETRLDLARSKGCDGVEPDNVDGWANATGFPLSASDQLTYNRFLAAEAHDRGLSVGLKNDLDQIPDLISDFDWALNEQCFQYSECDALDAFVTAGKAVFGVEYVQEGGNPAVFCPAANASQFSWLQKHYDLDAWRLDCQTYGP